MIAAQLAKLGYYGTNPEAVLNAPVDIVMGLIGFERAEKEYGDCYRALNKKE